MLHHPSTLARQRAEQHALEAASELSTSELSTQTTHDSDRRDFLVQAASMLGLAVSAGTAVSLINACDTTTPGSGTTGTLDIASQTALQTTGGAVRATVNNTQLVVIRSSTTEFLVFSATCTHAACIVNLPASGTISCDCHGSRFSAADGRVLQGPAVTALRRYTASFNASTNVLTITL